MGAPWRTYPPNMETVSESYPYVRQQIHKGHHHTRLVDYPNYSSLSSYCLTEPDSASLNDETYTPYNNTNQFLNNFSLGVNTNRGVRKRKFPQNQCFQLEVVTPELDDEKKTYINLNNKNRERFTLNWKNLPTWTIYFNDQRHRISNFAVKDNKILPDPSLNKCVSLCFEDNPIEQLQVDAVVTSTNEMYSGEFGVDHCIHEAAGNGLREACKDLPPCNTGNAEITPGFMLNARYVIHTVGPQMNENPEKLEKCYQNCLQLLIDKQLRTIAFPCISTGHQGILKKVGAEIALSAVRRFLESDNNRMKVDRVVFCLHNPKDVVIYRRFMQIYFPVI